MQCDIVGMWWGSFGRIVATSRPRQDVRDNSSRMLKTPGSILTGRAGSKFHSNLSLLSGDLSNRSISRLMEQRIRSDHSFTKDDLAMLFAVWCCLLFDAVCYYTKSLGYMQRQKLGDQTWPRSASHPSVDFIRQSTLQTIRKWSIPFVFAWPDFPWRSHTPYPFLHGTKPARLVFLAWHLRFDCMGLKLLHRRANAGRNLIRAQQIPTVHKIDRICGCSDSKYGITRFDLGFAFGFAHPCLAKWSR